MVILELHHLDQKCSNFQWHLPHTKDDDVCNCETRSHRMLPVHTLLFEIDTVYTGMSFWLRSLRFRVLCGIGPPGL